MTLRKIMIIFFMSITASEVEPYDDYDPGCHFYSLLFHDSCRDIKTACPNISSGHYNLIDRRHHNIYKVYCDMDQLCGETEREGGGWMRVGYLNMSNPDEKCPIGLKLYKVNGVRACGRYQSGGCQSVVLSTYNINYTQVCGRVTGYQKGSTDAIARRNFVGLNGDYVDGVSITRGNPRKHIWTFMAGIREDGFIHPMLRRNVCPCTKKSRRWVPDFIGDHYYCESGNSRWYDTNTFHSADPLWDGEQCGTLEEKCCDKPGIPWFHRTFTTPSNDDIELRICANENIDREDTPIGNYEIYVK